MRLIIAAIIRLCIVLYNDHNRRKITVLKAVVHNFGTMDSDPEGVIVEKQMDNIRAVTDPEFLFMHGLHSHCFCNKLGLGDVS